jgi:hypothetical protein
MSESASLKKYEKWLKDRKRLVHKHILIDRDLFRKICMIATERFGTSVRTIYLIINEALEEYVERHYKEK